MSAVFVFHALHILLNFPGFCANFRIMKNSDIFFTVIKPPVDFFMLLTAGIATYFLRTEILSSFRPVLFEFNLPFGRYFYLTAAVSLFFIASYAVAGLYSMKSKMGRLEEFFKIFIGSSTGIMLVIIYVFLRQELFDSRFLVLGGWFFASVFVFTGRLAVDRFRRLSASKYGFGIRRMAVIGDDEATAKINREINSNSLAGRRLVKHCRNIDLIELEPLLKNSAIDELILANPDYPADKILRLVDLCHENHVAYKFIPNVYQTLTRNFDIDVMGGLPLIELRRTALGGWGRVAKRFLDMAAAAFGLILFSPVFAATAFAIKWESAGPVFVRLKRISKNKEFELLKFRSMINNAEAYKPFLAAFNERRDGPLFKMRNDPRITRAGKFLRKYRLDELPQFWNILMGDISLIGPRPHQPDEIEKYQKDHRKVLAIKAGATGFAQVSGSSDLLFDQEVALDVFYIENWSLSLDLKIILKTVWKMVNDRSAV